MSKMGISTLQSYKGAQVSRGATGQFIFEIGGCSRPDTHFAFARQVFEAVGLADEVVDRCFTGTTTRIQGSGFEALYRDLEGFHEQAFPAHSTEAHLLVRSDGQFHYRDGGEAHLNTPSNMVNLQVRPLCDMDFNDPLTLYSYIMRLYCLFV
jgi:glutamate synthase domain-containing protein 2